MFASLKTSITASLAALTVGLALSAAPAEAQVFHPGHPGGFHPGHPSGFHPGHPGGFHPGFHPGGWGPVVDFGVIPVGPSCIVYQPIYDGAGNYLGQSPVNVCP